MIIIQEDDSMNKYLIALHLLVLGMLVAVPAAALASATDEVRKTVDDRRFRIWRVYLAGSSYGFERDWVSLYQVVCRKAGRSASTLPWSRDYIYQTAQ